MQSKLLQITTPSSMWRLLASSNLEPSPTDHLEPYIGAPVSQSHCFPPLRISAASLGAGRRCDLAPRANEVRVRAAGKTTSSNSSNLYYSNQSARRQQVAPIHGWYKVPGSE